MATKATRLLVTAVLSVLLGTFSIVVPHEAQAAAKNAVQNKQVADALTEAKRLSGKKQWSAALAALQKAKSVQGRSDYADYKIGEIEGYILTQQRNYARAADVFERLANSDKTPNKFVPGHWKTAAQLYMQVKLYEKAAHAATQALATDRNDLQLLELLAQSQYLGKNYADAASTLQQLISNTERSGKTPAESTLQMQLACYDQLHNQNKAAAAWESLLSHYPKQQYWEAVLQLKADRSGSEDLEVGYRRLMFDIGVLKESSDYESLALASIDAGVPSEAVRILQTGLDNGRLGGANEARYRRMLEFAKREVKGREQNLSQLLSLGDALPPQSSIELGRLYLSRGNYDEAISQFRRGLDKGDVGEEQDRIALGIAYLKSDQPDRAQQAFAAVDANSKWKDLAHLWSLHAAND